MVPCTYSYECAHMIDTYDALYSNATAHRRMEQTFHNIRNICTQ